MNHLNDEQFERYLELCHRKIKQYLATGEWRWTDEPPTVDGDRGGGGGGINLETNTHHNDNDPTQPGRTPTTNPRRVRKPHIGH